MKESAVLLALGFMLAVVAAASPADAHRNRRLRACHHALQAADTQIRSLAGFIVTQEVGGALGTECLPNGNARDREYCPTDCWLQVDPNGDRHCPGGSCVTESGRCEGGDNHLGACDPTLSEVCCNPYGSDDGVEDGSCTTRSQTQ